jgi:hypothetical protein
MIGIIGNKFFGTRIVENLEKKIKVVYLYPSLHDLKFKKKIEKVEIIHFIGSPIASLHGVLTLIRFRMWGKKIIVHWIGGDAWQVSSKKKFKVYTKLCKKKIDLHLVDDERLGIMLKKVGINSTVQPLPVANHYELEPLPNEKKILVYLPDDTKYWWNRFNGDIIKQIVNEFPKINFIIIKNSGKFFNESNVKCYKWIDDLESIYKNVIGMIRIPTHDGLPGTMVELLSMGRYFIYSEKLPYCYKAKTFEELKNVINEIIIDPKLNVEGAKYVNEKYNLNHIIENLINFYENI